LRIYPGADGEFTFYEDENDNYNYEKGRYARFLIKWDDKSRRLMISDTKGTFSGMLKNRVFNIVLVKANHGTGSEITATIDKTVRYTGKMISVQL
jgi:alpha-D-xyloside xylohydrolase